jgi:hypothetical protein
MVLVLRDYFGEGKTGRSDDSESGGKAGKRYLRVGKRVKRGRFTYRGRG